MNDITLDIISIILQIVLIPFGLALAPYMQRVVLALIEAFTPNEDPITSYRKRVERKRKTSVSRTDERHYPPVDRIALMKHGIVRPDPRYTKHSK